MTASIVNKERTVLVMAGGTGGHIFRAGRCARADEEKLSVALAGCQKWNGRNLSAKESHRTLAHQYLRNSGKRSSDLVGSAGKDPDRRVSGMENSACAKAGLCWGSEGLPVGRVVLRHG